MRGYGRLCGAGRVIGRTAFLILCLGLLCTPTRAEELADRVTIAVFGDSQAQGLAGGLQRILLEDPRYRVLNRTHPGAALVHGGSEWLGPVERFASREKADIAVVMFGANDRLDMRDERGAYLRFRTDDWRGAYAAYGKDRVGTTQRLRADDGIHFTAAGYELIAERIVGLLSVAAANAR